MLAVGSPEEVAKVRGSYTGQFLKRMFKLKNGNNRNGAKGRVKQNADSIKKKSARKVAVGV